MGFYVASLGKQFLTDVFEGRQSVFIFRVKWFKKMFPLLLDCLTLKRKAVHSFEK